MSGKSAPWILSEAEVKRVEGYWLRDGAERWAARGGDALADLGRLLVSHRELVRRLQGVRAIVATGVQAGSPAAAESLIELTEGLPDA